MRELALVVSAVIVFVVAIALSSVIPMDSVFIVCGVLSFILAMISIIFTEEKVYD